MGGMGRGGRGGGGGGGLANYGYGFYGAGYGYGDPYRNAVSQHNDFRQRILYYNLRCGGSAIRIGSSFIWQCGSGYKVFLKV
jgi:hypothetical protein